jgi:hypothetical protein
MEKLSSCSDINPEFPFTQTEVSYNSPEYFWVSGVVTSPCRKSFP